MLFTKIFRKGNSQAFKIPADIAYENTDIVFEIERIDDELRIRPVRRSLGGVLQKFAKLGYHYKVADCTHQEQAEREKL